MTHQADQAERIKQLESILIEFYEKGNIEILNKQIVMILPEMKNI